MLYILDIRKDVFAVNSFLDREDLEEDLEEYNKNKSCLIVL